MSDPTPTINPLSLCTPRFVQFGEGNNLTTMNSGQVPPALHEKFTLLRYFAQYMDENLTEGGEGGARGGAKLGPGQYLLKIKLLRPHCLPAPALAPALATLTIIATNNTERSSLQLCSALLYNPGLLTIKHFSLVREPGDDEE